jgi:S1-C subfamily serine protease
VRRVALRAGRERPYDPTMALAAPSHVSRLRRPLAPVLAALALAAGPLLLAPPAAAAAAAAEKRPAKPAPKKGAPPAQPPAKPFCAGDYADDLAALSPAAREFDRASKPYTFCIRTTATYECPYYSSEGSLKRIRKRVVAHGTGFGYRRDGNESLVVTNEHVADWPAVTDRDHAVEGVPPGCRRVSDAIRIVDDESDAYDRDDIPLTRVVSDPQLDISLLRSRSPLPVMPWKIGRSAALRERNAVDVRGFPLGVLRTTNVGKVTSAYEHDGEREWDHDDFVIDALLSPGNSGSPVFAVSCRTGEFELVGVYHAGYIRGSALNVVVGIDQVRELLETQRRTPRPKPDAVPLDAAARARVTEWARSGPGTAFPFGATFATVSPRADGALVFALMGREFPVRSVPVLALEDLPPADGGFGHPGRVWAGNGSGLRVVERAALEAEAQGQLARLLDALRHDAILAASFRAAARVQASSREKWEAISRLERSVRKLADARQDAAQTALDLADRFASGDGELSLAFADALAVPAPAVAADAAAPAALAPGRAESPAPALGPTQAPAQTIPPAGAPASR